MRGTQLLLSSVLLCPVDDWTKVLLLRLTEIRNPCASDVFPGSLQKLHLKIQISLLELCELVAVLLADPCDMLDPDACSIGGMPERVVPASYA